MRVLHHSVPRVLPRLIGVAMIVGGLMKLARAASQTASFAAWGLPPWFRDLVGTFEVLGGVLVLIPATIPLGTMVLATIMVGALWTHAAHREWLHLVPAAALLALLATIFRHSRARALRLLGAM